MSFIIPFIFVISIVVVIHELGHLLAARFIGVRVKRFSVGFGPAFLSYRDKRGTIWQIATIPLGGFVQIDERKINKSPFKKIIVSAAGPLSNFLFSFFYFLWIFLISRCSRI